MTSHEGLHISGFFQGLNWRQLAHVCFGTALQHCPALPGPPCLALPSLGLPELPTSDGQACRELLWKPEWLQGSLAWGLALSSLPLAYAADIWRERVCVCYFFPLAFLKRCRGAKWKLTCSFTAWHRLGKPDHVNEAYIHHMLFWLIEESIFLGSKWP